MNSYELGFFGNIWVRQNVLDANTSFDGHEHKFDHVTLLVSGRVSVQIKDNPPKEFTAPTFIVIRKDQRHKITALEEGAVYYCVFALRDLNGEVMEIFGDQHDPEASSPVSEGYWEKVKELEAT